MSKWNTKPLGELAENISRRFDFSGKEKVIFVNTGDVSEGYFLHCDYSDSSTLPGQAKKAIKKGDILYSEIRPGNKRYILINFDADDYVVSTKFMVIKSKANILPEYLYLILKSQDCEQEFKITADSRSGTFPQITFDSVANYPISYPDKEEQHRIVNIASSITGKIELNRQINQTLEDMAQALFKSWFVDFEPVKAKMKVLEQGGNEQEALLAAMSIISGKSEDELEVMKNEKPEEYSELESTAKLFPSSMVESELGLIPEGWEVTNFGSVSQCFDNKRVPLSKKQRQDKQGDIPYYGATSIMDYVDDYIFEGKYLLIGEDGSVHKEDGTPFVQYIWGKSWINNHAHVLQGKNGVSTEHLLLFISQTNIVSYVTGAVQLKINQRNMNGIPFILAPSEINTLFASKIQKTFELKINLVDECKTIKSLRDSLLPKLLSGEIEVANA